MTLNEHPVYNQNAEIDCLISGDFAFVVYCRYMLQQRRYDTL